MAEKIPPAIWQIAWRVGVIGGVIGSIIIGAFLFAVNREPEKQCISPEQVKELCVANGIELKGCKVKRPYVVVPKSSR